MNVGQHTYGFENIKIEWGNFSHYNKIVDDYINPELNIGKFCSIGSNIKVFLGGNHRLDWITTYPFGHINSDYFNSFNGYGHPCTNGDINIGNDVWIGNDVTIMSGVNIGSGSVISSNSYVVSNIKPYSVNGGNPCKFYYYRFEEEIINKLLKLKWWDMEVDDINKILPILCSNDFESLFKKVNL